MARKNITLEMRGMPRRDLVNYFIELGGKDEGEGEFSSDFWKVYVAPEVKCTLGMISVPSTKITFTVEETYFDEMLAKFRFKFLCAGG